MYGKNCLLCKAVYKWVEKFAQGFLKLEENDRQNRSVEIVTNMAVSQLEKMLRANEWVRIGNVTNATRYSHELAYSIMHDCLHF